MQYIVDKATEHLILLYQKYISPRKGYCCAHNALHNNGSCSSWALNVVRSHGALSMFSQISTRFSECNEAHKEIKSKKNEGDKCNLLGDTACCCMSLLPS